VDKSFLKEQADRCRSLAEKADAFTKRRLLNLAAKYEHRVGRPSCATRSLALPESGPEARRRD
jgi:hypothetical protein